MAEHISEGALRIDGQPDPALGYAASLEPQNGLPILRDVGLEKRDLHSELGFLIPGTSSGVSDMDNPDIGIFDAVMNAVWVSGDKAAT
ncbi:MAG TPA: hypothetical protein VGO49_12790 [Bradyrhizobium sp.]|jgi:hypothetical protein|nr:hypothetical protein [Bradyrhizobium sp.]